MPRSAPVSTAHRHRHILETFRVHIHVQAVAAILTALRETVPIH